MNKHFTSVDEAETRAIATTFAMMLKAGDVVCLKGDLGSGKSTFARAVIQTLCGETTEVPSPTFTLVQTYDAPAFPLWHFDLYRLENPDDIYELGIEEALEISVSLIEWPQIAEHLLPPTRYEVEFEYGTQEGGRLITLRRNTPGPSSS